MARSTKTAPSPKSRCTPNGNGSSGAPSARQSSLRTSNLALVARQVFASSGPASRADVATATGMTRSTASRLADELVATGILAELAPAPSAGPGRPAVPLTPAAGTFIAIGLEVNVSRMAVRAIDLSGEVLAERVVVDDFSSSDARAVLEHLAAQVVPLAALSSVSSARLVGAALALPGLVSDDVLLRAPNLGWDSIRPAEILAPALKGLDLSLVVGNEADLAALTAARLRPGVPGEHRDFIYLSGENGIGAGIVREGRIVTGDNGFAGEIGHVQVDPDGPRCSCGNRGCVERYAGRRLILAASGLPDDARPDELVDAWRAGDERARGAVSRAARALGAGLGAAINLLDIPVVVLGGHLAPLAQVLRPELESELERRVLASAWSAPRIMTAAGDQMSGATGAAWSLLEDVVADPSAWM